MTSQDRPFIGHSSEELQNELTVAVTTLKHLKTELTHRSTGQGLRVKENFFREMRQLANPDAN